MRVTSQKSKLKYFVTQYSGFLYDWSGFCFSQCSAIFIIIFQPLRQKHNVSGSTSARRNSSDLRARYQQEKYPPSKKEKRILKQRSQDSLSSSLIRPNASSQSRSQSEALPSPPETPRVQERPGRPSRPQSATDPGPGLSTKVSRSEVSVCQDGGGKETQAMVEEALKHSEVTNVQSSLGISENPEFQSQVRRNY